MVNFLQIGPIMVLTDFKSCVYLSINMNSNLFGLLVVIIILAVLILKDPFDVRRPVKVYNK